MSSFTSSSECKNPEPVFDGPRWYTPVLLLLVCTGLLLVEGRLRGLEPVTQSEKLVHKVLSDQRANVVIGDSHIGFLDYLEGFAFLGRPGVTMFEIDRTLQARFRWQSPGRVILEAGPQLFAARRQQSWRALLPGTLERQRLPWSTYFLEPELLNSLQRSWERGMSANLEELTGVEQAESTRGDWAHINWLEQDIFYSDIERAAHLRYMNGRKRIQRPVKNTDRSPSWAQLKETLDWLLASGAEVCLIRTPLVPEYMALLNQDNALDDHMARLRRLAARHGIAYVDAAELWSDDVELDYFANADHLSTRGHRVYWPKLRQRCFPG